jgi:hypothetical protein
MVHCIWEEGVWQLVKRSEANIAEATDAVQWIEGTAGW